MPQMTPGQARIVDPVLTEIARGYRNGQFAGMALFPYAKVATRGGSVIEFGRDSFKIYDTRRAPGARTSRVDIAYGSLSFALEQHAIETNVPREILEEAQREPGVDLARRAMRQAMDIIGLRLEKAQADLARNDTLYPSANKATLSGTSQWSDHANSDPIKAIEAYKEAVRSAVGVRPNTLVLGAAVFAQVKTHPKVTERIKYTSREVATAEILASLLDLQRVVVGDAIYLDNAGAQQDVWGKDAILAYTATSGLEDPTEPTFGYTYRLRGYPIVEEPYFEAPTKSWVYPVTDEIQPVIAGVSAGFCIKAAVA